MRLFRDKFRPFQADFQKYNCVISSILSAAGTLLPEQWPDQELRVHLRVRNILIDFRKEHKSMLKEEAVRSNGKKSR